MSIRIGILGYGNLGRGVECAVKHNPDLELVAVFTRRDPASVKILTDTAKVYHVDEAEKMKDKIDVLILCGGSATDLPVQTPKYAQWFNVVDSFDTHARIPEHFANVDKAASESNHVGIISVGWDPGMFSLNRMYANAILTNGKDYTFWGKGVSQGHSDAIRRIDGVKDGKQYTIPVEAALEAVRSGQNPELTTRQKHTRECYVVAKEGADLLYTLGTEGYFQGGFLSTDYTAATDLFFGGNGAMWYSGSGQITQASEMYKNGQLGFFAVPDVDGQENMETNVPIHGGFGTAFNAKTYDDTMKEFFEYMCNHYSEGCYNDAQVFSPFNDEMPEGLDQLFYDLQPLFENATDAWVSWDDKLDSATLTNIVDEQQKLAQGKETPEEFEAAADQFIINNSK